MFYFEKINNKSILKCDILENALFTTKESFIKTKDEGLNDVVEKNKDDLKRYLRVKKIISPNQRHTDNIDVARIDKDEYPETDALILKDKDIAIALNYADCTPVILYDKKRNIGAVIHAGWRGTALQIALKSFLKMKELGAHEDDTAALIGPCISKCCFEVDIEVGEKLYKTINKKIDENKEGKCYPDLKEINRIQLENAGLKNIEIAPYCTVCDNNLFFSYRYENGTTNRHSAILKLA